MTVTELGSEGRSLDHIGFKLPILAKYTCSSLIENPALVNSADCWLVFFLNLGTPIFPPFLFPLRELKKFL